MGQCIKQRSRPKPQNITEAFIAYSPHHSISNSPLMDSGKVPPSRGSSALPSHGALQLEALSNISHDRVKRRLDAARFRTKAD
jgi:hypothetical protein